MRFGREDDGRAPTAGGTTAGPSVVAENLNLVDDDFSFVTAVSLAFAGDSAGGAGINAKLVMKHGAANAVGKKGIPVVADDRRELGLDIWGQRCGDGNGFVKFGLVQQGVKQDNIGAGGRGEKFRFAESASELRKNEVVFVDIRVRILRNVFVRRFGSADLRG